MPHQPYKTYTMATLVNFEKLETSSSFLKGIVIAGNYKIWTTKFMFRKLSTPLNKWEADLNRTGILSALSFLNYVTS